MANDKKQIKKDFLNHDGEMTLLGIMVGLVALDGLLGRYPVGSFITYCFVCFFGVFYFVGLLYVFFLGFYLIFKKKAYVLHYDLTLLGVMMIFLAVLIADSNLMAVEPLNLQNFLALFQDKIGPLGSTVALVPTNAFGGGIIGFFVAAVLNTTITVTGTEIFVISFIVIGVILCFQKPIRRFFRYLKQVRRTSKEERAVYKAARELPHEEKEEVVRPVITEQHPVQAPTAYTVYSRPASAGVGLTKAVFVRGGAPVSQSQPTLMPKVSQPSYARPAEPSMNRPSAPVTRSFPDVQTTPVMNQPAFIPAPEAKPSVEVDSTPTVTAAPPKPTFSNDAAFTKTIIATPKAINPEPEKVPTPKKPVNTYNNYAYPPLSLLSVYETATGDARNEEVSIQRMSLINKAFEDLGVGAVITSYKVGPSVTRFDVQPNRDVQVVNVSKIITDISMRLGGIPARFEALVRGKPTSGLEIQNAVTTTVGFIEVLSSIEKADPKHKDHLMVAFGKDISGDVLQTSIKDFPHLLVAGTTGSGKSIFMHSLIMTLIMRNTPEELRLIIIDPKRVEMGKYRDMPHLLCPTITDYDKAKVALDKLVAEMENRYTLFEEAGVSDVSQYNDFAKEEGRDKLPIIVVVVDEYADLVEGCKDIAVPVVRVAQKARAAGIHLIISTQRPSVNVITGIIKANLPTRVALSVASTVDSMTILGEGGAEKLLGYGDMLVDCAKISRSGFTRVQGCFVDNKEIKRVVDFLKERYPLVYKPEFLDLVDHTAAGPTFNPDNGLRQTKFDDDMYGNVKSVVMTRDSTSISSIQREFGFGFPRAGKIFAQLQAEGIVAKIAENGATAQGRKVLVHAERAQAETAAENPAVRPPTPDFGGEK